ncbi:hypothetical protein [Mycobacteroides abscessus]|uniref:hypothetical protein n=1 Tax=Mycobacteroides abscessus TaxID=36809 RepID=UPI00092B8B80|nr:hypothetical protein [Mycobacteroides abscessus]SIC58410.1 Uncharacterised protein [Mycobacteroides abscessus subsp. abscessus]
MDNTVAIAAIGLATTAIGCLVWVVRFVVEKLTVALEENTKASIKQAQSSDDVLKFMKNLNGKLEGAFVEKVKEKSAQREN